MKYFSASGHATLLPCQYTNTNTQIQIHMYKNILVLIVDMHVLPRTHTQTHAILCNTTHAYNTRCNTLNIAHCTLLCKLLIEGCALWKPRQCKRFPAVQSPLFYTSLYPAVVQWQVYIQLVGKCNRTSTILSNSLDLNGDDGNALICLHLGWWQCHSVLAVIVQCSFQWSCFSFSFRKRVSQAGSLFMFRFSWFFCNTLTFGKVLWLHSYMYHCM